MMRHIHITFFKFAFAGLIVCGALAASSAFGVNAGAQRGNEARLMRRAQDITGDRFTFSMTTPRGVRVYSYIQPPAEMLRAIDDGLTELFAVAKRHNYGANLRYSDYSVFIAHPDRMKDSAGAYSPDIAIGAAQYAGSVFDKGGYVFAAGMVLAMQPSAFIIAEHDREWQRVANIARYEGEHIILYHNDRQLYAKTADHSRGGTHPILQ